MEHEFENARAAVGEKLLECVDLIITPLDRLGGNEFLHLDDQHIFIVRAVEEADEAARRHRLVDPPKVVVRQFFRSRGLERRDCDADRPAVVEYSPDGAVLAAGIGALQDDQKGSLALRIEALLEKVDRLRIADGLGLRGLLVGEYAIAARVDIRKREASCPASP